MSRLVDRLSKRLVARLAAAKKPGLYPDGNGLYLQITKRGTASWILMYKRHKRRRKMGLGALRLVDLDAARQRRTDGQKVLLDGVDPLAFRATRRAKAASAKTFRDAARAYIEENKVKWKNPKHVAQYYMTLLGETENGKKTGKNYCAAIHAIPVGQIDTAAVLFVLKPIWYEKPETAARLRGRIEKVIGYAVIHGLCGGIDPERHQNPARWTGHLENALPAKGEVREVKHHAALPYEQLPGFMAKLKQRNGLAARCLELAILTAVRTGDLIGLDREDRPAMNRAHVNLRGRMWTIPKTKTNVEHRVPLSQAVIDLLADILKNYPDDGSGIIFAGDTNGAPLSNVAMLRVRDRMIKDGLIRKGAQTTHGMRACFKSWAGDQTDFEKDVIEACLTHSISDKLEAAYRRSDFYAKRTRLMAAWADFVEGKVGANVITLHA
jgi:integrase